MIDLTALRTAAGEIVDQLTEAEIYHLAVDFTMMSTPIQSLSSASLHPGPTGLDMKLLASAIDRVDHMNEANRKQSAVSELVLTWLKNLSPGSDSGISVTGIP